MYHSCASAFEEPYGRPTPPADIWLPSGYAFADATYMQPAEVVRLLQHLPGGQDLTASSLVIRNWTFQARGLSMLAAGVQSADTQLVGYGSIFYKNDHGELGDFVVHPAHRGRGLGKAIIQRRLGLAATNGITSLYIEDLEATNHLRSHYIAHGFREGLIGDLLYGPSPEPFVSDLL
jgi:GNAT superfamily N-acetyltransferase